MLHKFVLFRLLLVMWLTHDQQSSEHGRLMTARCSRSCALIASADEMFAIHFLASQGIVRTWHPHPNTTLPQCRLRLRHTCIHCHQTSTPARLLRIWSLVTDNGYNLGDMRAWQDHNMHELLSKRMTPMGCSYCKHLQLMWVSQKQKSPKL